MFFTRKLCVQLNRPFCCHCACHFKVPITILQKEMSTSRIGPGYFGEFFAFSVALLRIMVLLCGIIVCAHLCNKEISRRI
uniref:Uncharacterized protein n=1 Tax=Romanomermis culicivorax TaxID=13658 RepID=A0A915ITA9_ROMCU